ncbi:hypothetical protein PIB30_107858 [Stylosanthes scabra]|uniref:Uncharacterized protein n=1 Tax=Stylosanthes scabra TaxID=79078 RepID=A0ABU6UZ43_9FABA|nr:hypothetical protein [Stylosanthes scabra]
MPRVKRPTKKSKGASSSMEPPPQDHPLAQWFYNKEDFDLYHSDFASRKVIPPRGLPLRMSPLRLRGLNPRAESRDHPHGRQTLGQGGCGDHRSGCGRWSRGPSLCLSEVKGNANPLSRPTPTTSCTPASVPLPRPRSPRVICPEKKVYNNYE